MPKNNKSKYEWFIISLGGFTIIFAVAIPFMCMPVFFSKISRELGLSLVELGAIWGMGGLSSMVMAPIGGLIGDKYGTKQTIIVSCILLGIAGASRALSTSFFELGLTTFFFGFVMNTVIINIHKCSGIWFSGKQVIIANGIISTAVAIGLMLGAMISDTVMAPLLGGWKNVLFFYGALSGATGLLWIFTKPAPARKTGAAVIPPPFMESLSKVLHSKAIWLKALIHFCYMGSFMGLVGYLALYLKGVGWTSAAADNALAALNGAGMFAAIPLTMLSGRIGSRKAVISPLLFAAFVCIALIPFFNGTIIWILVILFGLVRDGYYATLMTMVMETEGIGAKYAGTAIGIVVSFGNLGTFVSATVGNSLASINPRLSFPFWTALIAIALIILHFTKENKIIEPAL